MKVSVGLIALAAAALFATRALAANDDRFMAKVYDKESNKKLLLFTYQHAEERKNDVRTATNTYTDKDGGLAAIETVEFVKDGAGEKVQRYHMSQKQLGAEGIIEMRNGKLHFKYTKNGKTKTSEESLTDNFVIGPSVSAYLRKNWEKIKKGERVQTRFGVPDRAETVGFEFFKDREETVDGQKAYVIKMKPSSFLIAALVNPLHFFYTPDGEILLEVHGRTQVKKKVDGSYADLDAVTVYDYTSAASAMPSGGNSK